MPAVIPDTPEELFALRLDEVLRRKSGSRRQEVCRHAEDTGIPALPHRPCLGRRIRCRLTGNFNPAAYCRPELCRFFKAI